MSDKLTVVHEEMMRLRAELDGLKTELEQAVVDSEQDYIQSMLEREKYLIYKQKEDWLEIADEAADDMKEACDCVQDVVCNLELIQQ